MGGLARDCRRLRAARGRDAVPLRPLPLGRRPARARLDQGQLRERAGRLSEWKGGDGEGDAFLADLRKGTIAGTVSEALEQLAALEQAGLTRLMAQHLLHRDLDVIELIGRSVNPALAR